MVYLMYNIYLIDVYLEYSKVWLVYIGIASVQSGKEWTQLTCPFHSNAPWQHFKYFEKLKGEIK